MGRIGGDSDALMYRPSSVGRASAIDRIATPTAARPRPSRAITIVPGTIAAADAQSRTANSRGSMATKPRSTATRAYVAIAATAIAIRPTSELPIAWRGSSPDRIRSFTPIGPQPAPEIPEANPATPPIAPIRVEWTSSWSTGPAA